MAEFLAIHQSDASLLGCLLRRLAGRVSLGDSERAAGVGFFQSDDVLLRKRPLGGQAAIPEKLAEGVESELMLGQLEDMRCDMGQGFLFSRPLPYERFESWLQVQTAEDSAEAPAGEVRWLRAVP